MASHIGVIATFGLTPPDGAVLERSEHNMSCKPVKLDGTNDAGKVVTIQAVTEKYHTETVRISGMGVVSLASVTPGNITPGTLKTTLAKQGENNKGFPTFEQEALTYNNND